jgi:Spy/CpxP family protein refolding chaperone
MERREDVAARGVTVMNGFAALMTVACVLAAPMAPAQAQQPYAGMQTRPIKALSEEQIADLRAGRGMSLALAAELNGYPGPAHVVELEGPLGLSDVQRQKAQELFAAMKAETIPLGEQLISQETELDRQFAEKTVTEASLATAMQAIAATQATLRTAHLKYHLTMLGVLTPHQTHRYGELRGYASAAPGMHQHGRQRH